MAGSKTPIEKLEAQVPALAQQAFDDAFRRALAAGESVLVSEDGRIIELTPQGERRPIKEIEKPTPIAKGRRVRIR